MLDVHTKSAAVSKTNRSRVTNGTMLLEGIDGRSPQARRYRDLIVAYSDELGGKQTEAQRAMVRQAAAIAVQSETMQAQIVRGEVVDSEQLVRVSNLLARCLRTLSIGQVQPAPRQRTLQDHMAERSAT